MITGYILKKLINNEKNNTNTQTCCFGTNNDLCSGANISGSSVFKSYP